MSFTSLIAGLALLGVVASGWLGPARGHEAVVMPSEGPGVWTSPPPPTPEPTPLQTAVPWEVLAGDVLIDASFDDGTGPFALDDDASIGAAEYADGRYMLSFSESGTLRQWSLPGVYDDVVIQVDVTDLGPVPSGRIGVFCREPEGDGTRVLLGIVGDRVVARPFVRGARQPPVQLSPTEPAIRVGVGETNRLRAWCVDGTFTLYVNDVLVASFTDLTTEPGRVGVFAASGDGAASVAFDDVLVRAAE